MMSWLLHNPVASMPGPIFLFFYTVVIVLAWFFIRKRQRQLVENEHFEALPLPPNPDPYAIAYLRGGEKAVADLALLRLLQDGALKVIDKQIKQNTAYVDNPMEPLTTLERKVYEHFAQSSTSTLDTLVKNDCLQYQKSAIKHGLLFEDSHLLFKQRRAESLIRRSKYAILALGLYKLLAALINGHQNIIFLVILILGVLLGFSLSLRGFYNEQRLTAKGKDLLDRFSRSLPPAKDNPNDFSLQMLCFAALGFASTAVFAEHFALLNSARIPSSAGSGSNTSSDAGGCTSTSGCSSSGCSGGGCSSGCGGCSS